MVPALRTVLIGYDTGRTRRTLVGLFVIGVLLATFGAYTLGLFAVSGGVIVLPGEATLVGVVAAAAIDLRRGGLLVAWLVQFAAYIGFHADWAFLGPFEPLAWREARFPVRSRWPGGVRGRGRHQWDPWLRNRPSRSLDR